MTRSLHRREFIQNTAALGAGIGLAGCLGSRLWAADAVKVAAGAPHAEKIGWRLACQLWTFNRFTFFDAVDKTASLGLHYVEAFPGQRISATVNDQMGPNLSAGARKDVLKKLSDSGVKLVNFGVGGHDRELFDFAKEMGVETLVSEPKTEEKVFDEIDKLCAEYEINLALHNHPKNSTYWNPDTVLKMCEGRSKRIGACADTGHWARSGLTPLECLKKLEGRIVSVHFKDLNQTGPGTSESPTHDVPWGTGVCNVKGMLAELHRQKLKAVFSIEYEYHWDNSVPEIAECVAYFDKVAAELA
jgi:sugar phosphate isomerase/epimerase